jgi:cytochrome o ubiquinol oxidase subunit 2
MNAFYIPALAGMIYTMPGMETQLNAVINKAGVYDGFSANYSGAGFSDMRSSSTACRRATSTPGCKTKADTGALTRAEFLVLDKPTIKHPIMHFGTVDKGLYDLILNRCVAEGSVCINTQMHQDASRMKAAAAAKNLPKDVCEPSVAATAQPTRKE